MKWLEIIELRTSGSIHNDMLNRLTYLIEEVNNQKYKHDIKVYYHINIENDFSIHIVHDTDEIISRGSDFGIFLASTLKYYGLINHNVWKKTVSNSEK